MVLRPDQFTRSRVTPCPGGIGLPFELTSGQGRSSAAGGRPSPNLDHQFFALLMHVDVRPRGGRTTVAGSPCPGGIGCTVYFSVRGVMAAKRKRAGVNFQLDGRRKVHLCCLAGRFGSPVRIVTPIRDATVRPIVRCAARVACLRNEENCQSRRRIPLSRQGRILSILTRM